MALDDVKRKLEKGKEQLIKELDYYKKEDPYLVPDRTMANTVDDDITETEGHDRITATRLNLKQSLAEVNSALKRVEDRTYGICKNCGKKIPKARLEVIPTAALCVECNQKIKQ